MGGRLKCRKARMNVEDLLDDRLDEPGRISLDEHLSGCSECREYRVGARRAQELLQGQSLKLASDAAVNRMWEKLEGKLDEPALAFSPPRSRRWSFIAAAAAVTLLSGMLLTWALNDSDGPLVSSRSAGPVITQRPTQPSNVSESPAETPIPTSVRCIASRGTIRHSRGDTGLASLTTESMLLAGDRIVTEEDSTATVRLGDIISAHLGPSTSLQLVDSSTETPTLELLEGWLVCEVSPLEESRSFDVHARGAVVRVVGTVFAVETVGENEVEVRVAEGRVEVSMSAEGEERVVLNEEQTALFPSAATNELDDELAERDLALTRGETTERPRSEPALGVDELFELAEEARRTGRHAQAATLYRRIASMDRSGAAGGTALISLGQLCVGRLGRPGEARRAFEAYLSRNRRGPLSQEAYVGLMRAHRAQGRTDAARRVARQYLDTYVEGRYRHVAREVLGPNH